MKTFKYAVIALLATAVVGGGLFLASPGKLLAHCQIPCGIYNDDLRFALLAEHVTTIEKSMNEIGLLQKSRDGDPNQMARWIGNKEAHADALTEIVVQYFLQQRVKPVDSSDKAYNDYTTKLALCHGLLVSSMKAKQTTDLEHVKQLRSLLGDFEKAYHGHAEG